jgi:5'-3' exonuclease
MKYVLLVDGMNLAWKAIHAYDLSTSSGVNTSAIFGFMSQLASVMDGKKMPVIVVWDGGYKDRLELSTAAVKKGIVKAAYKSNRGEKAPDEKTSTLRDQLEAIKEFLTYTDVKQVYFDNEEADDVIASYANKLMGHASIICLTCDHDYYQLLDSHFSIVSRWKGEESMVTLDSFVKKYGIEPWQWVEVGALAGDSGDCIIGVPGCGDDTAIKYIQQYQSAEGVISAMSSKFDAIRAECPDLESEEEINELMDKSGVRGNASTIDGCYPGMPYTGVAWALATGQVKKISKIELKFAMYQERIRLAYRLKKMNRNLPVQNVSFKPTFNESSFRMFCQKYELKSLLQKMDSFAFL